MATSQSETDAKRNAEDDFETVVRDRRSVHDYSDEDVSEGTLREVFDLVRYTPSGYNLQPWEFLVLTADEDREALQECAGGQEHVTDAPVAVEETRDGLVETIEGWRDRSEEQNTLWTTRSTSLAAMTLMHAARSKGLSTCPMEGFDDGAVRDTFDVPEQFEPVMLVTMGYPAEDADDRENERKFRRSVDEITHFGGFDA